MELVDMGIPDIGPDFVIYWVCWNDLDSERSFGGRIPWSAIAHWAEFNYIIDFDSLKNIIWAMDDYYLRHIREKQEVDKNQNPQDQELKVLERLKTKKAKRNG